MKNLLSLLIALSVLAVAFAKPKVGDKAPDFELPELFTGKIYKMQDFKGKVVLLNLWASWCTGCKAEMPEFYKLQQKYKDKNFIIVAITVDNQKEKAIKFLKETEEKTGIKTPFIVLWDKGKKVARIYRPRGMPSSYLIDKDLTIKKVFIGSFTEENIHLLEKEIQKLLEN